MIVYAFIDIAKAMHTPKVTTIEIGGVEAAVGDD